MKQSHWLLCVAKNCDWSRKITPPSNVTQRASRGMKTYSEDWTAKSTNPKENTGKINSVFVIRTALWGVKVGCFLQYCRSSKNALGRLAVEVNTGRHLIRVLNVRSVSVGGNLCPLWLVILKLVWHGIGDTLWLQYSWPRAVVSYSFLAVVPWNGLEHLRRKVRLGLYFNWI